MSAAFERRAERALALARESAAAREPLEFLAGLNRAQAEAARSIAALHAERPWTGDLREEVGRVWEAVRAVLGFVSERGPGPLAAEAAARAAEDEPVAHARLAAYWEGDDDYLSRAALRPWAEFLAGAGVRPRRPKKTERCAFCGGAPWVGSRREEEGSNAAVRFLHCALCGSAWQINRIVCAACGERDPHKLPSFSTESHPEARIEACETCRRYVKSIDLTTDATRIPEVDDLSSIALDLWAREQGFSRIEPGAAGL